MSRASIACNGQLTVKRSCEGLSTVKSGKNYLSADSPCMYVALSKVMRRADWPGRDVASLLHEGSRENHKLLNIPNSLDWSLVVWSALPLKLLTVPFVGAETADQEKGWRSLQCGGYDAHPRSSKPKGPGRKRPPAWTSETHDGDPQTHKRLGEIDHLFPDQGDS